VNQQKKKFGLPVQAEKKKDKTTQNTKKSKKKQHRYNTTPTLT